MVTFLDYYPTTEPVSMTLFLLCQMINDVDSVFLHDGCSCRSDRYTFAHYPKSQRLEASQAGLLCPNNQEALYL